MFRPSRLVRDLFSHTNNFLFLGTAVCLSGRDSSQGSPLVNIEPFVLLRSVGIFPNSHLGMSFVGAIFFLEQF